MTTHKNRTDIAILGGGPSGLFLFKRLIESGRTDIEIAILEAKQRLGAGMPYSQEGSNDEHVTNVSDNEIPPLVTSVEEWVQTLPDDTLSRFQIDKARFNEYKVLPRLLFGLYLEAQFHLLLEKAEKAGIRTRIHLGSKVTDLVDHVGGEQVEVIISEQQNMLFDRVVISTGHNWPKKYESVVPGYFDSPYPPSKLKLQLNHSVAIKGSSLTAIDAIRTLARNNGSFHTSGPGKVSFEPSAETPDFKLVMHSISGLLPAVRFHLEEPLITDDSLLNQEDINKNRIENEGFLSLDFVFEKNFKAQFAAKEPAFYAMIKDLTLEEFVALMMDRREEKEPFELLREEYQEAARSIRERESVYWKEMLATLSFAMNYPAKYLSAEDMQRLQKVLMPLISIVIAFAPQSSCEELMALHNAGKLEVVPVTKESTVKPEEGGGVCYSYINEQEKPHFAYFKTFVDCVGQPHLSYDAFPFQSMLTHKTVSPARIRFRSASEGIKERANGNKDIEPGLDGNYYLKVPGITINDNFQVVDGNGIANERIYMMAVPYIGGYNPDYSGLDFCEQASAKIAESLLA